MDTTFDINAGADRARNGGKTLKNDLKDGARAIKDTATEEYKNFVADVEDVIKGVADASDADVARVRAKIEAAIASTKNSLEINTENLKRQAREAAKKADDYVQESPWQAIGIGAAIAALVGLSVGYLAARR